MTSADLDALLVDSNNASAIRAVHKTLGVKGKTIPEFQQLGSLSSIKPGTIKTAVLFLEEKGLAMKQPRATGTRGRPPFEYVAKA